MYQGTKKINLWGPAVPLVCKMGQTVLDSTVKHFYYVRGSTRRANHLHVIEKKKIPLHGNYLKNSDHTIFCYLHPHNYCFISFFYTTPSLKFTLVALSGNAFLISLLNNWNTHINILQDECWVMYHIAKQNPSFTFLWSCYFSACYLLHQNPNTELD